MHLCNLDVDLCLSSLVLRVVDEREFECLSGDGWLCRARRLLCFCFNHNLFTQFTQFTHVQKCRERRGKRKGKKQEGKNRETRDLIYEVFLKY